MLERMMASKPGWRLPLDVMTLTPSCAYYLEERDLVDIGQSSKSPRSEMSTQSFFALDVIPKSWQ